MTITLDHIDPIWFSGEKEEPHYEQLVCGLDIDRNHRMIGISENSQKADRFLQWRVEGDSPAPCDKGDMAWFLIKDEWVWTEFLGDRWLAETKRQGRFHQARQGRASARRQDGFIGWRDRQDASTAREAEERRISALRTAIESGKRWGFMLSENKDPAKGGRASGRSKWMCMKTGMVLSAGPLSCFQMRRGIDRKHRVKLTPNEMAFMFLWDTSIF